MGTPVFPLVRRGTTSRLLVLAGFALALGACKAAPPGTDTAAVGAQGPDAPVPRLLTIGEVQGTAATSPLVGQQVSIKGVVVGNFSTGLQGVFVQSERADDEPRSAEGLFVEHRPDALPRLRAGDRVRVTGRVAETGDDRASLTTLRETTLEVIGRGAVEPVRLEQAPAAAADWERYEGMLVAIAAPLTVTGNNGVASYGEIQASFGGRLFQATEVAAPGPAAQALAADNARRLLLLDDNRMSKDPRKLWFLPDGVLGDAQPLRAGSVLRQVVGVLDQRRGQYRLQLTGKPRVEQAPRPPAPTVAGDLRIASLNLLNLFNGDGQGQGFPTERGADTADQHQQQQRKLVAVVQALAPDVAALMEVENDGSGPESALAQFVAALNAAGPASDYRAIDTGPRLGEDGIRVAMIYRASRVSPQGRSARLTGGPFAERSRVPLAQAFRAGAGPTFVVAANHFKSKGCGREQDRARGADADQGDGQACWNPTRVESARRLHDWLASDPTGTGSRLHLIVGDLNAHAQEDPLRLLRAAGWQDAFAGDGGTRPYSFVFDGQAGRLDHALLDAGMAARLRGAAEWHANADESPWFDYHRDRDGDPWRASDHDPILLGFDLTRQRL